jgi:hypothetical protein
MFTAGIWDCAWQAAGSVYMVVKATNGWHMHRKLLVWNSATHSWPLLFTRHEQQYGWRAKGEAGGWGVSAMTAAQLCSGELNYEISEPLQGGQMFEAVGWDVIWTAVACQ